MFEPMKNTGDQSNDLSYFEHGNYNELDAQAMRCDDDLLESQQLYPYTFKDFGTMIYISKD